MVTGSVTLNNITMSQMVHVLQAVESNKNFVFNPQQMQAISPNQSNQMAGGQNLPHQRFNNVNLGWSSGEGLETLVKLLEKIHGK